MDTLLLKFVTRTLDKSLPPGIVERIMDYNRDYEMNCRSKLIWCRICKVYIGNLNDHQTVHRLMRAGRIRLIRYNNHAMAYDCRICHSLDCWCLDVLGIEKHVRGQTPLYW